MNIAEELESMGRSERRALANCLAVLPMHWLKWCYHRSGEVGAGGRRFGSNDGR